MRRFALLSTTIALATGHPAVAHAIGYIPLPGDLVGYDFDFTTVGTFSCRAVASVPAGACSAIGNTMTIISGSQSLTLTFTGNAGVARATNGRPPNSFEMGTITQSVSGTGPFSMPGDPIDVWFGLNIRITSTTPAPFSNGFTYAGRTLTPNSFQLAINTELGGSGVLLEPTLGLPPQMRLGLFILDDRGVSTGYRFTPGGAPVTFAATTALAPEPATIALLGSGLLALGGLARRRRNA